jgi:two-component system LytT family response regulator
MTHVAAAPLRVVIVDDEAPARARLQALLANDPEIDVTAVCAGGGEAIAAIERERADLVFLDVQMPEIDGFDVIETVGVGRMPRVVFVTAFEQHAAHAFEVQALDYLLKPFDRARFDRVLARAKAELRATPPAPQPLLDWLLIRDGDEIHLVKVVDIDWIEAAGNYVAVHAGGTSRLLRRPLAALEARLDPGRFLRIHRDTLVQVDRIRGMHRWQGGQYRLELIGGVVRPVGRSYQAQVERRLGKI